MVQVDKPFAVLNICTGNICRSPMADGLLRKWLVALGVLEGTVIVGSAGLWRSGVPAEPEAVVAARKLGASIDGHVSRTVTPQMARQASLILCMERMHVRELAVLAPDCLSKTFAFRDFVRRAQDADLAALDKCEMAGDVEEWVTCVGEGRTRDELLDASCVDDVVDPYYGPQQQFDSVARDIDGLTESVARLLVTSPRFSLGS